MTDGCGDGGGNGQRGTDRQSRPLLHMTILLYHVSFEIATHSCTTQNRPITRGGISHRLAGVTVLLGVQEMDRRLVSFAQPTGVERGLQLHHPLRQLRPPCTKTTCHTTGRHIQIKSTQHGKHLPQLALAGQRHVREYHEAESISQNQQKCGYDNPAQHWAVSILNLHFNDGVHV